MGERLQKRGSSTHWRSNLGTSVLVRSFCRAKVVRVVSESLGQNHPGELLDVQAVCILLSENEKGLG